MPNINNFVDIIVFILTISLYGLVYRYIKSQKPDLSYVKFVYSAVIEVLPRNYKHYLIHKLYIANYREEKDFQRFILIKAIGCGLILGTLNFNLVTLILSLVMFMIPDLVLLNDIKLRQESIKQELPKKIDLLLLCIDSGLSLDTSLNKIIPDSWVKLTPLEEELSYLNKDILFGINKDKAYSDFYNRTNVSEIGSLVASLSQSNRLGISIANILRNQSDYLINKTAQNLEAKAHKLPILMAFPLWFFIMPSLLIVVLGPSMILFFDQIKLMRG